MYTSVDLVISNSNKNQIN